MYEVDELSFRSLWDARSQNNHKSTIPIIIIVLSSSWMNKWLLNLKRFKLLSLTVADRLDSGLHLVIRPRIANQGFSSISNVRIGAGVFPAIADWWIYRRRHYICSECHRCDPVNAFSMISIVRMIYRTCCIRIGAVSPPNASWNGKDKCRFYYKTSHVIKRRRRVPGMTFQSFFWR